MIGSQDVTVGPSTGGVCAGWFLSTRNGENRQQFRNSKGGNRKNSHQSLRNKEKKK